MHCWKNPGCFCCCCKQKELLFNEKGFCSSRVPEWEFTISTLVHVELRALGAVWAQSCWCCVAGTWLGEAVAFSPSSVTQGLPLLIQLPDSQILLIYFCGRLKPRSSLHTQPPSSEFLLNSINPGDNNKNNKNKRNPQSVEIKFLLRKSS